MDSKPGQFTEFLRAANVLSAPNARRLESTCVLTDIEFESDRVELRVWLSVTEIKGYIIRC